MTATQRTLSEAAPMQSCDIHGEYDPAAYFTPADIDEMLDELGRIDCPLCLMEMVDWSSV